LISARSERAAAAALEQLEGRLSVSVGSIYDNTLSVAADLEATLDFDEGELPEATMPAVVERLGAEGERIQDLLDSWEEGHILREGALVAIAGQPNVGKSTLLNRLLGAERAIVSGTPGTTRDTIEELVVLDGIPLRLVDTAGLREANCSVEREGVERAEAVLGRADLVLYVIDSSAPLREAERHRLGEMNASTCLVVLNKTDLGQAVSADSLPGFDAVACSLLADENLAELQKGMLRRLHIAPYIHSHAVISERHRQLLQNAQYALNTAKSLLEGGEADMVVPAATLLREGLESIGQITGRVYSDELLDNIFSRFCIGK